MLLSIVYFAQMVRVNDVSIKRRQTYIPKMFFLVKVHRERKSVEFSSKRYHDYAFHLFLKRHIDTTSLPLPKRTETRV